MKIDGFLWFIAALIICGVHVLYLRSWQRESRQRLAWWHEYDKASQARHDEFMKALSNEREQA